MKNSAFILKNLFTCSLLLLISCFIFSSCQKDSFILSGNALLNTSVDTLKYDTVFTSIGSVTQSFKINNTNNQKLLLSTVKLMSGTASAYSININGNPVNNLSNIEVAGNDSIYVFVSVKINPNTANLPFVVKDSILIAYNGNNKYIQLEAYGQNANFLRNRTITSNITWANNLPYVILGGLTINAGATLNIEAGCKIYAHANAPILVNGSLITNGTLQQPVTFNGDRLDGEYKDFSAAWPGIYFTGSSINNVLTHTLIKNAVQAVVVEKPANNNMPKLILHQCIIDNASDVGLLSVNSSITADNSLITNCGNNISLTYGGVYNFINCTVAAYSTNYSAHNKPVLLVNNSTINGGNVLSAALSANFTNCIFWGDGGLIDNEVVVDKQGVNTFTVLFDHCIYKDKTDPVNSTITKCIKNQTPLFDNIDLTKKIYNFNITNTLAPGIDKGLNGTGFTKDLNDNNRVVNIIDIGCYEKQ